MGNGANDVKVQETLRVLIVEDDRTSRMVLKRILQGIENIEVVEAEDGWKTWEILDGGFRPGLSFLDINMPRMSGSNTFCCCLPDSAPYCYDTGNIDSLDVALE